MLCLGIDNGTNGSKPVVLHIESGKVIASAQEAYETMAGLRGSHCEPAPETWIEPDRSNHALYIDLRDRQNDLNPNLATGGYL